MRAKLITTVLSAAFMAGAAQIVAVAEPANTQITKPEAAPTAPVDVKPVGRPQVDAATSIRETRLVGATVISIDEKETGEVREIVDDGGSTKAVVEYEGLLGGKRVAIPIADFTLIAEGRARVGLSEAEIKDLPNYGG